MREIILVLLLLSCGTPKLSTQTTSQLSKPHLLKIESEAKSRTNDTYQLLADLVDTYPHRLSGSAMLESAIAWSKATLDKRGLSATLEPVMVPNWVRGQESLEISLDGGTTWRTIPLIGLGGTVATKNVEEFEIVVANSYEDLGKLDVKGKAVLFDVPMPSHEDGSGNYGAVSHYRMDGPNKASNAGASAMLLRSLTTRSMRTPHTGMLDYDDASPKIPAAAISTEDSELISRASRQGKIVKAKLLLSGAYSGEGKSQSSNVVAEIMGAELPKEVVVISAHIDSWDVGQGAHDDGGGCVAVMQALSIIKDLGVTPKRTIRMVHFTNEENGLEGGKAYAKAHQDDVHVLALESDTGSFTPRGLRYQGDETLGNRVRQWSRYLGSMNRVDKGFAGADLIPLTKKKIPAVGVWLDTKHYFDLHHTAADTLDKVDKHDLAKQVELIAKVAWLAANE